MTVLFLTDNFPPEVNAPASRTYEHACEWVKKGVRVKVITCNPNFPKGKIYDGYKNRLFKKEIIDGIEVIRVWSYIAENKGFSKRILDFTSYALMAFFVGLFIKADVIIGTSPQFFTAVSAKYLSIFKMKPWIMEVRDIWPESIAAVNSIKRTSQTYKFLERLEISLYKSANNIVVVTDSFKKQLSERGIFESKIHVVKNGVNLSSYKPQEKEDKILKQLRLENKFVVSYIGTLGSAHALGFILECLKDVDDPNIHFLILGEGSERLTLIEKAKELKLTNVQILSSVSKSEVKKYINISDVALVNLKKSNTFLSVIPSKIFENVAMQKPILLGVDGEARSIVEHYKVGLFFEPENKSDFLNKLSLIKNFNSKEYKHQTISLLEEFNRSKLAIKMLKIINDTMRGGRSLNQD